MSGSRRCKPREASILPLAAKVGPDLHGTSGGPGCPGNLRLFPKSGFNSPPDLLAFSNRALLAGKEEGSTKPSLATASLSDSSRLLRCGAGMGPRVLIRAPVMMIRPASFEGPASPTTTPFLFLCFLAGLQTPMPLCLLAFRLSFLSTVGACLERPYCFKYAGGRCARSFGLRLIARKDPDPLS